MGLVGCSKKEKTLKEIISKKHNFVNQIKCDVKEDIIYLGYESMITKNNYYEFNTKKIFSNEQNCKVKTDIFSNIDSYDGYGYAIDEKLKSIKDMESFGEIVSGYSRNICSKEYCLSMWGRDNYGISYNKTSELLAVLGDDVIYSEPPTTSYTFVSVDNKIKRIKLKEEREFTDYSVNYKYAIDKIKDVETNFENDEKVISINQYYVKTDRAYYRIKKYTSNKEECEKYADVKCKKDYKIVKDEALSDNYEDIIFAGELILDKDNNLYLNHYDKYYKN